WTFTIVEVFVNQQESFQLQKTPISNEVEDLYPYYLGALNTCHRFAQMATFQFDLPRRVRQKRSSERKGSSIRQQYEQKEELLKRGVSAVQSAGVYPFTFRCLLPCRIVRLPIELRNQILLSVLDKVYDDHKCNPSPLTPYGRHAWMLPCAPDCERTCPVSRFISRALTQKVVQLASVDRSTRNEIFHVLKDWLRQRTPDLNRLLKDQQAAMDKWADGVVEFQTTVFKNEEECRKQFIAMREIARALCVAKHHANDLKYVLFGLRITGSRLWPTSDDDFSTPPAQWHACFNSEVFYERSKLVGKIGRGNYAKFVTESRLVW
ncbi:MAG: hypothetical protein M1828_002551, partial [Chrysothrix sp. TS-e1954]